MKKRILTALIAVMLLLAGFSVGAAAENTTVVQEWNIALGDDICANFYLRAPANAAASAVKVTVAGKTQNYALSEPINGMYQVCVHVAAAQMTEDITLQLVADGVAYTPVSYSVQDYAAKILAGKYSENVKNMVRYMLHYGAAAQTYFGIKTDDLANAGNAIDYTAQYPAQYVQAAVSGQMEGVQAYGATLVLDSKVAVRYYFAADSLEDVSFSANGASYLAKAAGELYYVQIPGIAPQNYADAITLTAQRGDEQLQVTYSPMTYMVRMSEKGSDAVKTVVNAMYGYYVAATDYIENSAVKTPIFSVVTGSWDLTGQHNGILSITDKAQGATVITNASDYTGVSVTVKDHTPSKNADGSLKAGDFSAQVYFIFDDGKQFQIRLHNTDVDKPNYKLQTMGESNSLTGWKWQADLTTAQKAKLIDGDGVEFAVKLVGSDAQLWVDGSLMKTVPLGAAYAGKTAQIKLCLNGNVGVAYMQLPFTLTKSASAAVVAIPAFENGKVTADKTSYQLGDTVTLTVVPDAGYSQKLYINGKALMLDWKSNQYRFVATEAVYNITGSFAPSLDLLAKDEKRWDTANQAHGILNVYYPGNTDSWLMYVNEECASATVKVKNDLAGPDGTGGADFATNLGIKLSNGKEYIFRIVYENGKYYHQRFGINGSDWKKTELSAADRAAVCGEGAEFKLERTAANTLKLSVNGVVYDTYIMDGVTEDIWVSAVILGHYGLKGQKVEIPYSLQKAPESEHILFQTGELSKYTIVYENANADYLGYANQLKACIAEKYGVTLSVVSDRASTRGQYEILLGDTNRYDYRGRVMEYSVTVDQGVFRINVGGSCSAENAINYLCRNVFNGQAVRLGKGEHYRSTLLTNSRAVTNGSTARIMSANVLADAFSDDSYKTANYRVEILMGALVAYSPDVVGLQEVDGSWNRVLDGYLTKIQKTHGIQYSRYWATYEGKTNYSSLLYRSDKFKVGNSGVQVFSWWKDLGANYRYHMRNISWAQFVSLENANQKFVVANTHWSYRTEHADGNTYLTGATRPIATDELRTQCKNETASFMASLKKTYSDCPVFLVGDFNTSLPYFTSYGWTPASYAVISEQAKNNGTALSTVPTSNHFDHIFGTGSYTVKCFALIKDVNQHSLLTDHPFVYVDLAF